MQKKLTSLCKYIFATLTTLPLISCDITIYQDNWQQKNKNRLFIEDINKNFISKSIASDIELSGLPTYPKQCRIATPVVPQESCINLAIEGANPDEAQKLAIRIFKDFPKSNLRAKYARHSVVLLVVVRSAGYEGSVTPYALNKDLVVAVSQLYFQIGE